VTDYEGRLELTWTNKALRLLAHEDGNYQWVPPGDFRVAEVRLLHDVAEVGEVGPVNDRARDNLLIRGDALHALTSLAELPEFSPEYLGKVKLAYLDPPFNTGQSFLHYDDALEHSVWLGMMRDRLLQVKRLLSPDGSAWVHLDDSEMAYCRVMVDEILGRENFVGTVVWEKSHSRENRTAISTTHDYVLVYARERSQWDKVRNRLPASDEQLARFENPDNDPRGVWASLPMHAKAEKGRRAAQFFDVVTPSGRVVTPPPGRCWLYTKSRYEELLLDNRISFGKAGQGVPRVKKFLTEVAAGLVPVTIWPHTEIGTTGNAKAEVVSLVPERTPFSTPKPERLLHRIWA